jgi:hypothetical protein
MEALVVVSKETGLEVYADNINTLGKGGRVQIFGNNLNKPKFYSGRKCEWIEIRECVLLFGAESFAFQFAIQKFKD